MSEPIIWRGLSFFLSPESHRGYERWDSEEKSRYGKALWSADRYSPSEGIWTARLLVDAYRCVGEGPNMHLALDAALEKAKGLRRAIGKALPK